jgi:hypothetical protein
MHMHNGSRSSSSSSSIGVGRSVRHTEELFMYCLTDTVAVLEVGAGAYCSSSPVPAREGVYRADVCAAGAGAL